jgi:hypothetical protein
MTTEQLKKLLEARPFRPFIVHLGDGDKIPVNSPEFVALSPSGRTFAVGHSDSTFSIVDLLLVTRLEAKPVGNGGRRARRT